MRWLSGLRDWSERERGENLSLCLFTRLSGSAITGLNLDLIMMKGIYIKRACMVCSKSCSMSLALFF